MSSGFSFFDDGRAAGSPYRPVALVTGASGAIGEAISRRLCADGYSVVIGYNGSEAKALSLASELCSAGYNAIALKADVSDSSQVDSLFEKTVRVFGDPEVVVNNAGIAQQKLFCDITDEEWNRMIGVNLTGPFCVCRRALPSMIRKKNGVIVNISSMWGQVGASCETHYSAAKAGLVGLTKALAKEVAPCNIRVNCVCPGAVDTAMMSGFSAGEISALCDEIPLGRLGLPKEIADSVAFLASDSASYITGQILAVNGGFVI